MGIFSRIKDAIFGKKAASPAIPLNPTASAVAPQPAPVSEVDVIVNLEEIDRTDGRNLNWRTEPSTPVRAEPVEARVHKLPFDRLRANG